MSKPEISLTNCIDTPQYFPSNNMLSMADSGANIHLEKQDTTTMDPVIMSNEMTEILLDGSTMKSSHIATLQLPVGAGLRYSKILEASLNFS